MPLSLEQLIEPLTASEIQTLQLRALGGVGYITQAGTNVSSGEGTGSVAYVSGDPDGGYSVVIGIVTSGEPSAGTYRYSTDGGLTYSATATLPASGASWSLGATGVTLAFLAGPDGAGTSFVAGDTYSFDLAAPSFPVTAWQPGSVPRSLVAADSQALASLEQTKASLARSAFISTAEGSWQDLVATEVYNLPRNSAVATKGIAVLSDTASAGPFTVPAGTMWIAAPNGLRYVNVAAITIPKSDSTAAVFQAEAPGAAYNVGNGSITSIVAGNLPGVTVSNPDAGSGTWITVQGADTESQEALASRCKARWPALGTGATAAVYDLWARTATPGVTRTAVFQDTVTPGKVNIYVAGPNGGSGPSDVLAVMNYIDPRIGLTILPTLQAATNVTVSVAGTVIYDASVATLASVQAGITNNLTSLFQTAPIGLPTGGEKLYLDEIREAILTVPGVRSAPLTTPGADVTLSAGQVPTLSLNFGVGWTFTGI